VATEVKRFDRRVQKDFINHAGSLKELLTEETHSCNIHDHLTQLRPGLLLAYNPCWRFFFGFDSDANLAAMRKKFPMSNKEIITRREKLELTRSMKRFIQRKNQLRAVQKDSLKPESRVSGEN
jgi:hypothetical protein